jgi:hypothetical protein
VTLLRDYFDQCFSKIPSELRDPLAIRVASVSLYGTVDPLTSDFLLKYISVTSEEGRRKFASSVYEALRKAPVALAETQWDRWMREYWLKGCGSRRYRPRRST